MRDLNFALKQLCIRNHDGSIATRANRERNLSLMANQLHILGYRHMSPHSLKPKHISSLIKLWQEQNLSTGTIKNRLAHLRWWAEKVNKPYVIPKSNDALDIPRRVYVTNEDKSIELSPDTLNKISNERVRVSLMLQRAFGLRTEESIKFRPFYADQGDHIRLKASWCKGGHARTVPILTQHQREVLKLAHSIAGRGSLIPRDFSYIQQLNIYKDQCYGVGLAHMHGLRHAYAQQRYLDLTGWPAPVAGGPSAKQLSSDQEAIDLQARLTISNEFGHKRESITTIYLGR